MTSTLNSGRHKPQTITKPIAKEVNKVYLIARSVHSSHQIRVSTLNKGNELTINHFLRLRLGRHNMEGVKVLHLGHNKLFQLQEYRSNPLLTSLMDQYLDFYWMELKGRVLINNGLHST